MSLPTVADGLQNFLLKITESVMLQTSSAFSLIRYNLFYCRLTFKVNELKYPKRNCILCYTSVSLACSYRGVYTGQRENVFLRYCFMVHSKHIITTSLSPPAKSSRWNGDSTKQTILNERILSLGYELWHKVS